MDRLEEELL